MGLSYLQIRLSGSGFPLATRALRSGPQRAELSFSIQDQRPESSCSTSQCLTLQDCDDRRPSPLVRKAMTI
ncbi:hypothetical protein PM082_015167 [Marasmius tenuissimus]|nr:hypothetical protein PM082_015167 [Marasmius tenuissimus]